MREDTLGGGAWLVRKVVRTPSLKREYLNGARWEDIEKSMLGRRNSKYRVFRGEQAQSIRGAEKLL